MRRKTLICIIAGEKWATLKKGNRGETNFYFNFAEKPNPKKLNLELFIARRLLHGQGKGSASVPIVKIAVAGIALGVCFMLLSVFIIMGFKEEITHKLSGFMAHLNITAYENNESYTGNGILVSDSLTADLKGLPGILQVYPYINKPAILKSKEEIHGVILRGVDTSFDAAFYRQHLVAGDYPDLATDSPSADLMLSSSVASLLEVSVGDKLNAYFVQEPPRTRVFRIKGIYDTGFKEYDDLIALCDIRHLKRLNGWDNGPVSGVAVELHDLNAIPDAEMKIDEVLPVDANNDFYRVTTLQETAPQIFDWLNLLNTNIGIILTLIIIVAGFNMVSGLLILILDKTSMIGILKALGYKNIGLRKLFLYVALGLIARGVLVGNGLAFLLGGIQYYFHLIRLDPDSYYMDTVPVSFDIWPVVLLNISVLIVSVLMLIVPTVLISGIKPIKAIRFE